MFGSDDFAGNPVTVHALASAAGPEQLQAHARTCHTIDNAYYWPGEGSAHYHFRSYSHAGPILICGHALLATAHHLGHATGVAELILESPDYRHRCRIDDGETAVEVPAFSHQAITDRLLEALLHAAGVRLLAAMRCDNGVFVITCDAEELRRFDAANFPWRSLDPLQPGALILTAGLPDGGYGLRYFAPWYGKPEDGATGSAQCYLAPIWLQPEIPVTVRQWSPAGTGLIDTMLLRDSVRLGGRVAATHDQASET